MDIHTSFSSSSTSSKAFFKSLFLNNALKIQRTLSKSQLQRRSTLIPTEDFSRDHHQHRSPPKTITFRLPPELWSSILRYATLPPFPWSATSPSTSPQSDPDSSSVLSFDIRLRNYTSEIKWKASLTRVSKEWNGLAREFLWEHLWIASGRDGTVLAALICRQPVQSRERTECQRRHLQPSPPSSTPITTFSFHPQSTHLYRRTNISSFIKKLHIESPSMDRCCPFDLMAILERCQQLQVFIDLRSVRRGSGFGRVQVVSGAFDRSRQAGNENDPNHLVLGERHLFPVPRTYQHATLDPILQALLERKSTLKHLTFTNYKYNSDDFDGGVWFWVNVARAFNGGQLAVTLESLGVVMSTTGMGMGEIRLNDHGYGHTRTNGSTLLSGPNRKFEASLLTTLNIDINSGDKPPLILPSLHSLRIPLTAPTLLAISTWSLPSLQSLTLVSIDFTGWKGKDFKNFMHVHGGGLIRFEIVGGADSGEEGWITEREEDIMSTLQQQQENLHLPSTSPNLKHFICSSNASEWNWETPNWIAPHVLMPEHFGVERIGVWGLEGKVARGGTDAVFSDDRTNMPSTPGVTGRRSRNIRTWATSRRNQLSSDNFHSTHDEDEEDSQQHEQPFFMLQEQFGSLLRREAFPSLVCIRDMSWESDLIRRSVGIGCGLESSTVDPVPIPDSKASSTKTRKGIKLANFRETVVNGFTSLRSSSHTSIPLTAATSSGTQTQTQSYKIRKFWLGVLEMCDQRGVYLEDWMGRRVVA